MPSSLSVTAICIVAVVVAAYILVINENSTTSDNWVFDLYPRASPNDQTPFHTRKVHTVYVSGLADYDHVRSLLLEETNSTKDQMKMPFEPIKVFYKGNPKPFAVMTIGNVFYEESSADSYAELIPGVLVEKSSSDKTTEFNCDNDLCIFKEMVRQYCFVTNLCSSSIVRYFQSF